MLTRFLKNPGYLKIPETHCWINDRGESFDEELQTCPTVLEVDREKYVHLKIDGEEKLFKISVLVGICFKALRLPVKYWNNLNVLYVDGDRQNVHPSNLVWSYPKEGITIQTKSKIYRAIPGYSRYAICEDGDVINIKTEHSLSPYRDMSGYLMFGVQPDVGHRTICGQHRLLALAFLPYGSEVNTLDVNHKDGVKANNALSNLEWLDRRGNCEHAFSMSLRPDNKRLLVRNAFTGNVYEFYSISSGARHLEIDEETMRLRSQSEGQSVYYPGLQFKLKDCLRDWKKVKDPVSEMRLAGKPFPIKVTLENGETRIGNCSSVSSFCGLGGSTLATRLRIGLVGKFINGVRVDFLDYENLCKSAVLGMKQ